MMECGNDVSCQTVWSFPPNSTVPNCPLPGQSSQDIVLIATSRPCSRKSDTPTVQDKKLTLTVNQSERRLSYPIYSAEYRHSSEGSVKKAILPVCVTLSCSTGVATAAEDNRQTLSVSPRSNAASTSPGGNAAVSPISNTAISPVRSSYQHGRSRDIYCDEVTAPSPAKFSRIETVCKC